MALWDCIECRCRAIAASLTRCPKCSRPREADVSAATHMASAERPEAAPAALPEPPADVEVPAVPEPVQAVSEPPQAEPEAAPKPAPARAAPKPVPGGGGGGELPDGVTVTVT